MLRPHTPLFNVASDAPDAGGQGAPEIKATIGQQLRAALSSKTDLTARLDAATDSLAAATAERDTARADLATAQARITDLEAQLGEVNAALTEHQGEVTKLKATEQDLEKRADAKTREKMATLGFPASRLPASEQTEQASSADLWAAAEKESDPVKKGKLASQAMAIDTAARKAREAA